MKNLSRDIARNKNCSSEMRRSFTLVELLISMAMIALLASTVLFALYGVSEHAKEVRTRSQIARLHSIISEKWESYRTRAVPLSIPPGTTKDPSAIAWIKLVALRELMRMELPERITDLNNSTTPISIPSLKGPMYTVTMPAPAAWRSYRRVAGYLNNITTTPPATWSVANQYSECLYLIVAATRDGERSALEYFTQSEIGDTDNDGMREILDGWGRPIYFLRWAPGFTYSPGPDGKWGVPMTDDNGDGNQDDIFERGWSGSDDVVVSDIQRPNAKEVPDPFDPLRVDYRWWDKSANGSANTSNDPFALVPLIVSAGKDGVYDIYDAVPGFSYAALPPGTTANTYVSRTVQVFNNDPYIAFADPSASNSIPVYQIGMPFDGAGPDGGGPDGFLGSLDNITNHLITTRQ